MNIPTKTLEVFLKDAITRDRTTARRVALLNILFQERYLSREQLIVRVEGKLGRGCFGDSAWKDTFYRDMKVVKQAFREAGYRLVYSRRSQHTGYYLRDQTAMGAELSMILDGGVSEIDRSQIAILKQRSFEQRFRQGCSISNLACQIVANRIRQRNPEISFEEAQRQALQGRDLSWITQF
jgi:hypothetical protein